MAAQIWQIFQTESPLIAAEQQMERAKHVGPFPITPPLIHDGESHWTPKLNAVHSP